MFIIIYTIFTWSFNNILHKFCTPWPCASQTFLFSNFPLVLRRFRLQQIASDLYLIWKLENRVNWNCNLLYNITLFSGRGGVNILYIEHCRNAENQELIIQRIKSKKSSFCFNLFWETLYDKCTLFNISLLWLNFKYNVLNTW